MLTEYQAQKIRRDMEPELNARGASVIACLAGLVVIVVLAVAEPGIGPAGDASRAVASARNESPASQPAAPSLTTPQDMGGGTIEKRVRLVQQPAESTTANDFRR